MKPSILITGAGGMLGSDLSEVFKEKYAVLGFGRHEAPHLKIPYQICDISDAAQLKKSAEGVTAKIIFHCAAMTQVDLCESEREEALRHNVEATKNVAALANSKKALLVFFSTDYVFDGKLKRPYVETDAYYSSEPIKNFYGETKRKAETIIQSECQDFVIFRVGWLYGSRGKCFPKTILKLAETEKVLKIVSDQIGCPTFTKDIASHMMKLLETPVMAMGAKEIYHLANAGSVSWADFARFILKAAGKTNVEVLNISSEELSRPAARPKNSILNTNKLKQKSGISMRPWEEAARDFVSQLLIETNR